MSAQHPPKNGDGRFVQTVVSPGSNHAQPAARISEGCTAARSRADLEPKHELRKTTPHSCPFVSIRGSKNTPREDLSGQISGWNARATKIRGHSWFKKHPQRSPCRADLGLESPSYKNSCPFVFIRGSKNIPREDPAGQISGWKAGATTGTTRGLPSAARPPTPDTRHPTPDTRHRPLPKHLPKCLQPPVQLKLR